MISVYLLLDLCLNEVMFSQTILYVSLLVVATMIFV